MSKSTFRETISGPSRLEAQGARERERYWSTIRSELHRHQDSLVLGYEVKCLIWMCVGSPSGTGEGVESPTGAGVGLAEVGYHGIKAGRAGAVR